MKAIRVYIGYDPAEEEACRITEISLSRSSSLPVAVTRLNAETLAAHGLLRRPIDSRGGMYDLHSNAPQSTQFAVSRFLVPIMAHSGWALFVDGDVVFLGCVSELFKLADSTKAVQVVKHQHEPVSTEKMVGQVQTSYVRKNWSSVCLWNVDHPANRRLTLDDVNHRPGRDLHAFYWLHDDEIGELPAEWNWLVGVQPKPERPRIAHFTLGGPFLKGWIPTEHDEIWHKEVEMDKYLTDIYGPRT